MAKAKKPKRSAKKKTNRKVGRPAKKLNAAQITKLAKYGLTQEEMADFFNVSVDTIARNYAEAYKKGRAALCESLKRKQVQLALKGDKTMLVWLGKQYLGQKERHEVAAPGGGPLLLRMDK